MRTTLTFAALALAAATATTSGAGCYDPGDLGDTPYKCSNDYPACPDGYVCANGRYCTRPGAAPKTMSLTIPKTMGTFGGTHVSIIDGSNCPNKDYKPNQSYDTAKAVGNAPLSNLAICPAGDIDIWRGHATNEYARVRLTYKVQNGDIDVAFLDDAGKLREYDGSAVDNGCVASTSPRSGDVWIGIAGANNKDWGPYSLQLDLSPTPLSCAP